MADPWSDDEKTNPYARFNRRKRQQHQDVYYEGSSEDEIIPVAVPLPPAPKLNKPLASPDDRELIARLRKEPYILRDSISERECLTKIRQLGQQVARPAPVERPKGTPLDIYLLDVDTRFPDWGQNEGMPVFRIFGLTQEGNTVLLNVEGYAANFHARVPQRLHAEIAQEGESTALGNFLMWLEKRTALRASGERKGAHIRAIRLEKQNQLYGYNPDKFDVLRIELYQPSSVPFCRDVLLNKPPRGGARSMEGEVEDADAVDEAEKSTRQAYLQSQQYQEDSKYGRLEVYEADILYILNFMVDNGLGGCSWFRVPDDKVHRVPKPRSRCQIERSSHTKSIESLPDKSDTPPVRIASGDIECWGQGRFPVPELDPIICISVNLYKLQDGNKPMASLGLGVGNVEQTKKAGFFQISFGSQHPVVNPKTGQWNKEAEIDMLLAFHTFYVDFADPDLDGGFNYDGFDRPYLFRRADVLGIGAVFRKMSRIRDDICYHAAKTFSSAAFGTRTDLNVVCPGRIAFDTMRVVRRNEKLRSYSLNHVSEEFLGQRKHEVSHDRIGPEWCGPQATPKTRLRILEYNQHDEVLSYQVLSKKLYIWNYQELARVAGVTMGTILKDGQGVKSVSLILREIRKEGLLMPTFASFEEKCQRSGFMAAYKRMEEERHEVSDKAKRAKTGEKATPKKKKKNEPKTNADDEILEVEQQEIEGTDAAYQGATVIDPILGYYGVPVVTLDFSSLYPSIIIEGNYCWSTWTNKEQCEKLGYKERPRDPGTGLYIKVRDDKTGKYFPEKDGDYIVTSAGHYFVTPKVREGVIPRVLLRILGRRKIAKDILKLVEKAKEAAIKARAGETPFDAVTKAHAALEAFVAEKDPGAISMFHDIRPILRPEDLEILVATYAAFGYTFDAKQLALKVTANSLYGFTGAVVGALPLRAIAESVTAEGRRVIEKKRYALERELPLPDELTMGGRMRPIVIGGDTDSVFFILPNCPDPASAMKWGKYAAGWLNEKFFSWPMSTLFEKLYFPSLYIAPKRYGGVKYEKDDAPKKCPKPGGDGEEWDLIDVKGVESVRRDNYPLLSECVGTVLRKILSEKDIAGAVLYVADLIEDLRNNKADLSKLIVSKALSKEPLKYAPNIPVHAQLAEKMRQRDPATAPRVGDRVPYLLVYPDATKKKDIKVSACGEDPDEVLKKDLPVYQSQYVEMLRKPIARILEPILKGITGLLFDGVSMFGKGGRQLQLDGTPVPEEKEEGKKVRFASDHAPSNATLAWARSVSNIKSENLEQRLREHLNARRGTNQTEGVIQKEVTVKLSSSSRLMGLLRPLPQCVNCGKPVYNKPPTPTCEDCSQRDLQQVRVKANQTLLEQQARNTEKWDICGKCVGSVEEAESCSYKECSNYFARAQTRKDLEKARAALARFEL
jgi:DNA polymerase elongation subunit (family B)